MGWSEYFILFLFMGLGLLAFLAALLDADWFFETSGASTFVKCLGRRGARVFYALLGLGLISCGVAGLFWW